MGVEVGGWCGSWAGGWGLGLGVEGCARARAGAGDGAFCVFWGLE